MANHRWRCSLVGSLGLAVALAALMLGSALLSAGATTTQSALSAKTLAVGDMPSGWSVDDAGGGGVSGATGCFKALQQAAAKPRSKELARASVSYQQQDIPALSETLISGSGADARYARYLGIMAGCKQVSLQASGITITGNVSALSLPAVGDSSHAFAIALSAKGITVGIDLVLFRVGSIDGQLTYLDFSPDPSTFQAFATEAVNKIEGKPFKAPNDGV